MRLGSDTDKLLNIVQLVQIGLALARELGISYEWIARKAAAASAEGRQFTLEDAEEFLAAARAELDRMEALARAARDGGN